MDHMLDTLLAGLPSLPSDWQEGEKFALPAPHEAANMGASFIATYAPQPFGLIIRTPRQRILDVVVPEETVTRLATSEVLAAAGPRGELLVTFCAWHTLVGIAPPGTAFNLSFADGGEAEWRNPFWVTEDRAQRSVVTLGMGRGGHFALVYGDTTEEAAERARAGLTCDVAAAAAACLERYRFGSRGSTEKPE
jgi:hypothetical protein